GCTGNIAGDHGSTNGGPGDGTTGPGNGAGASGGGGSKTNPPPDHTGALDDAKTVPAAAPLRRLTKLEYDNTVRDLLGVNLTASGPLSDDQGSGDSGFTMGGSISG